MCYYISFKKNVLLPAPDTMYKLCKLVQQIHIHINLEGNSSHHQIKLSISCRAAEP